MKMTAYISTNSHARVLVANSRGDDSDHASELIKLNPDERFNILDEISAIRQTMNHHSPKKSPYISLDGRGTVRMKVKNNTSSVNCLNVFPMQYTSADIPG